MIEKINPKLFKKYLYKDGKDILRKYALFGLYCDGIVKGYAELNEIYGEEESGLYNEMIGVMIETEPNSYLDIRYGKEKHKFWIQCSKKILDITNKMIENKIDKRRIESQYNTVFY